MKRNKLGEYEVSKESLRLVSLWAATIVLVAFLGGFVAGLSANKGEVVYTKLKGVNSSPSALKAVTVDSQSFKDLNTPGNIQPAGIYKMMYGTRNPQR